MGDKEKNENTAVAVVELTPAERAVSALKSPDYEMKFRELLAKSDGITKVVDAAGRAQVHQMYMDLKNARTGLTAAAELARADAVQLQKAVIKEGERLIAIISPREKELLALRDEFDKRVAAERQAKIDAERARRAKIDGLILAIKQFEIDASLSRTCAQIDTYILSLDTLGISPDDYQERHDEALNLRSATLAAMNKIRATKYQAEQEAIQAARKLEEERQRIAAEKEALRAAEEAHRERMASEREALEKQAAKQRAAIEVERDGLQRQMRELAAMAEVAADAALLQAEKEARTKAEADALALAQAEADAAEAKATAEAQTAIDCSIALTQSEKALIMPILAQQAESPELQMMRDIANVMFLDVIAAITALQNFPYQDVLAELAAQEIEEQ